MATKIVEERIYQGVEVLRVQLQGEANRKVAVIQADDNGATVIVGAGVNNPLALVKPLLAEAAKRTPGAVYYGAMALN